LVVGEQQFGSFLAPAGWFENAFASFLAPWSQFPRSLLPQLLVR
jgi:hypothetical protein